MALRQRRAPSVGTCALATAVLLVALAAPAQAADEEQLSADFDQVRCDVMGMPGSPTATYIEEGSHGPFLQEGNEWIALTLTSAVGDTEVSMPVYGETYSAIADDVIIEITLCQGAATNGDAGDAGDAGNSDPGVGSVQQGVEPPAGPPVETDGPASEPGPGVALIGGTALLLVGAGAAALALLRRTPAPETATPETASRRPSASMPSS